MKVYCKNQGCEFIIKYDKIEEHLSKCLYSTIICEHCNYNGIQKNHKIIKCYYIIKNKLYLSDNENVSFQKIINDFQMEINNINNINTELRKNIKIKDNSIHTLNRNISNIKEKNEYLINQNNYLIKEIQKININYNYDQKPKNDDNCCIM